MAKIVDTTVDGIIKPLEPPLWIRLCSFEFLDGGSPKSALGCVGIDSHNQDFVFIASHRFHDDNPSLFIFNVALETQSGSRFRKMVFRVLREKRNFIVNGSEIPWYEVEKWFYPDDSEKKKKPCPPPPVITDWYQSYNKNSEEHP